MLQRDRSKPERSRSCSIAAGVKTLAARRAVWLIVLVKLTSPSSATDRFALLIEALCASVAASHARGLAGPVIVLIWGRLRRMAARFAAATAIPAAPGRASRPVPSRPAPSRPRAECRPRLPGGFGWLIRLSPAAACHGGQLQRLLADPEMAALLATPPRMGRLLRPLCRMLAIEPPPGLLAPPDRARRPAARAAAPWEAATPTPSPIRSSRAACRDPYRRRPCDLWLEPPRRRAAAGDDGAGDTGPGLAAFGTGRFAPA